MTDIFTNDKGEEFEQLHQFEADDGLIVIRPLKPEPKLTDCWIWAGPVNEKGYGMVSFTISGKQRTFRPHRVMYELAHGIIPDGLVIDHLCRTPLCINPEHLEAVTQAENVRRGKLGVLFGDQKYCNNGHELTEENSQIRISKTIGNRYKRCLTCRRIKAKQKRAETKSAAMEDKR